jgi:hypothetical protein
LRSLAPETSDIIPKSLGHCIARHHSFIQVHPAKRFETVVHGFVSQVRLVKETETDCLPLLWFDFAGDNTDDGAPVIVVREPVELKRAMAPCLGGGHWRVFGVLPGGKPARLKQVDLFCVLVALDVHLEVGIPLSPDARDMTPDSENGESVAVASQRLAGCQRLSLRKGRRESWRVLERRPGRNFIVNWGLILYRKRTLKQAQ